MTFSEKAKPLWDKTNLTLEDIASECNISASMVSRYINGKVVPQADIAEKMLVILGAEPKIQPGPTGVSAMQDALSMVRDVYEGRITDMHAEINDLKTRILQEKREKWIFFVLMVAVVACVFTLLYIDIANGDIGWFRH